MRTSAYTTFRGRFWLSTCRCDECFITDGCPSPIEQLDSWTLVWRLAVTVATTVNTITLPRQAVIPDSWNFLDSDYLEI